MREYTGPKSEIVQVAVVPGTPARLAAVDNANVYLWNLDYPKPIAEYWGDDAEGYQALTTSPDGRWVVAGPIGHLGVYETATLRSRAATPFHKPGVIRADFVGESDRLTIIRRADQAGIVLLREDGPVTRGRKLATRTWFDLTDDSSERVAFVGPEDGYRHSALSADGSRFAFSGWHEKAVTVWDATTGRRLGRIPLRGTTECIALSPDGSRLAVDGGTTVYVHDATSLDLVTKWKANYSYVPQLAWSPDGRLIGRTDRSTTARLYDATTGRQVAALGTKRGRATAIAFAPDGLTYATGHSDGTVRVWDVEA